MGCAGEIENKGFSDKIISGKNKKDAKLRGVIIG
jgi:hypothetical protein